LELIASSTFDCYLFTSIFFLNPVSFIGRSALADSKWSKFFCTEWRDLHASKDSENLSKRSNYYQTRHMTCIVVMGQTFSMHLDGSVQRIPRVEFLFSHSAREVLASLTYQKLFF
jgi:hypothetical protein